MKIVEFDNGKWALRKFSFFDLGWVYKDLKGGGLFEWRPMKDAYFKHCLTNSEEELRELVLRPTVVRKLNVNKKVEL